MYKGSTFLLPSDSVPEIVTPFDANEEQVFMSSTAAAFVAEKVLAKEASDAIEAKDFALTRKLMKQAGELGFLGADLPERWGGLALDKLTSTLIDEQFGRQGSFGVTFAAHRGIGTLPILYFGSDPVKEKYLPKLVSGEWIGAYSLTESGSGSDAAAAKATAVRDGDVYVLNGEKMFVTNGGIADVYTVFAQVPGRGLSAFVVERAWPGVSVGKEEHKTGIRGSSTTPLALHDVRVPADNLLGQEGKGLKIALNILNIGRFKLGTFALGAGKECLAMAVAYARQRTQFGRSIADFGMVRKMLAGMAARIDAMEAVVYRTAGHLEEGLRDVPEGNADAALKAIGAYAMECSIVKVFCAESLWWIADANVQVHGGYGYTEEYAAERYQRDSRINRLFEGTDQVNRLVIFDTLARRGLPGREASELDLLGAIKAARAFTQGTKFALREMNRALGPLLPVSDALRPAAPAPLTVLERLNNAKRAVLLGIGAAARSFGKDLADHQVVIGAASDSIIALYVLDSLLAALAKRHSPRLSATLEVMAAELYPSVGDNVRELFTASMTGPAHDKAFASVALLVPDVPFHREANTDTLYASVITGK